MSRIPAEQSMHRFLQHLLPKGFRKVRAFGLWHPKQRHKLKESRANAAGLGPRYEVPRTSLFYIYIPANFLHLKRLRVRAKAHL